ncbi:uncharacterized protein LOC105179636 isoform X4 [Sesamum indicum]|uniref:Uncharacterized protein LOC105179636 isoform X4 n=1 Tax=Sesamum indicum TaxID=4182 RepID=A0A8M8UUW6_SESIN|nr:uncharacterized protein LOC105179636 isoform X4 [Sesamum indicum]
MEDQQSNAAQNFGATVQPVVVAAWRGRFKIPSHNLYINVAAHVSNKACMKVLEVASTMPESLCLEMFPRLDVWPASFKSSPPTEQSIALFFFPEGRGEEILDCLLNDAICTDFALKGMIGKAELLIFSSLQLPEKLHRFQGKLYFWGVFRGQQAASYDQSDYYVRVRQILSSNSGNYRSFEGQSSVTISSKHSPSNHAAKADKRGRRLDDAWEHARPLDELRQKAECRYCGFVSTHGGISRLKAHLGGGNPRIRLPACHKVSPEVKKDMADWFSQWVKNTKALWTKEIRAEAAAPTDQRGRPHDVAWEHAKPLDKTECKYFSFGSLREEISHHKVHLGGGDRESRMEAWPEVSTETKEVMSERVKNSMATMSPEIKGIMFGWEKSLAASRMKKSQAGAQAETRGRPLDNAWEHAKPLDEARQKTQCNHCGFVSLYGGISRLKAHLGGGCPQLQLQGCPRVSLEVKSVMEQWFNEWVKNSSAAWTRKSHAGSARHSKRGRPLDDTWEHAIPLDEIRQATKCKYCGFISKRGGILRLKAHLAGGDPTTHLEGCPNVPPEVKSWMAEGMNKRRKGSKAVPLETVERVLQEAERKASESQWSAKRHHILQETLDEIMNKSLKKSLQKIIDEKNARLQKMQSEIQSLESRLASMP